MTYGWNIEMQMKAARAGLRIEEIPMPYRCRMGGQSKVAGSLRGTLHAGGKILSTFVRVAAQKQPVSSGDQSVQAGVLEPQMNTDEHG